MRRRLFGRSHDSAASGGKLTGSKDPSPSVREADKDNVPGKEKESPRNSGSFGTRKGKKSSDGGKHGDRLSIFGGSFVGPLTKHRKPPPRFYQVIAPLTIRLTAEFRDDIATERSGKFTLPRLQSRKSSVSHRSTTPVGSPNEKMTISASSSPVKERHSNSIEASKYPDSVLRKPTSSAPHAASGEPVNPDSRGSGIIKQGQSILQQIGEPDHAGWMRKKGERYNKWKSRYFVMQGPHLYCLRTNSNTVCRVYIYEE